MMLLSYHLRVAKLLLDLVDKCWKFDAFLEPATFHSPISLNESGLQLQICARNLNKISHKNLKIFTNPVMAPVQLEDLAGTPRTALRKPISSIASLLFSPFFLALTFSAIRSISPIWWVLKRGIIRGHGIESWELPSQELPDAYWQEPERQIRYRRIFLFPLHGGLGSEMRCDFEI